MPTSELLTPGPWKKRCLALPNTPKGEVTLNASLLNQRWSLPLKLSETLSGPTKSGLSRPEVPLKESSPDLKIKTGAPVANRVMPVMAHPATRGLGAEEKALSKGIEYV